MNSTIELTVRNKDIHVRKADKLVTGQTNNEIKFYFDSEPWNSLSKIIIFRVEDLKMEVAPTNDVVKIPFEIFDEIYLGKTVYVGVYGLDSNGVVIYPTTYFRLGVIERGANTEGASDPSAPSLNIDKELLDRALKAVDEAKASADAAKVYADRAATLAADVSEKAAQTAQDASDAAKAMEAVQTAQRLAEAAQKAAETAKQAAETAQSAANKSATDADGAKQAAETALKSAQDAAAAAAKALADIRTLYQEMQTWAQGVIHDVNAAGSAAVQSVQSAGDTQVQRVTDEGATQTTNAKAQADAAAQSAAGAAQSAQEAAESAAVYDDVVADVNQLKQDLINIAWTETSANLFDPSKIEEKSYFNYSNGKLVSNNLFFAEYVPVTTGYYTFIVDKAFFGDSGKRVPLFDNEKNYLGFVVGEFGAITDIEAAPVTIEITNANTAFIGVSQLSKFLQTMMVVKGQEYPSEYIPYIESTLYLNEALALTPTMVDEVNGLSGIIGKTAIFDGDSICKGTINGTTPEDTNGWAGMVGTANSMNWHNYGISGGVITSASNSALSGRHSVVDNVDTMHTQYPDADFIIFEGGTNDADLLGNAIADQTVLGTYTDLDFSGSYDATTFTGALETIFCKATQYWVGKKIGFIVAQKMGYSTTGFDKDHANRRAYFERAIDICKKWGIPYLNLWDDCYLNPNNPSCYNRNQTKDENIASGRLYTDGQHLTKKGYQYISPIVEDWMKSL